jgi:hypothetical protein
MMPGRMCMSGAASVADSSVLFQQVPVDIPARATRGDQATCQEASCNPASHNAPSFAVEPCKSTSHTLLPFAFQPFSAELRQIMRAIAQF